MDATSIYEYDASSSSSSEWRDDAPSTVVQFLYQVFRRGISNDSSAAWGSIVKFP